MATARQGGAVRNILADPDDEQFSIEAWASGGGAKNPLEMPRRPLDQSSKNGGSNEQEKNGTAGQGAQSRSHPAWTELKTKAGKDRKRLPLACIACRRKKIRCSGEKPACKHCLKSRIPCVYKVTAKKAAPRTDYMAMLDKRLKRMEERVIKIIPKDELEKVSNITRAVVKPAGAQQAAKGSAKKRSADEAFDTEIDDWANTSRLAAKPDNGSSTESNQKYEVMKENSLLTEGAEYLPEKDIQDHLIEVFFDYLYGQSYYLLHKPSFMRKFAAGEIPAVLILAMCAISARFSNHPKLQTEPAFLRGESWANPAREIALKRFDSPNITILSVFLILGLHEFGTCQGGRSWMLGGMAHRMAYALQLHKDLDHDPQYPKAGGRSDLSVTDREIRRRTMWACFMMDRFNSSGTDRPMFASEQYMHIQLPIREDYFQMEMPGQTERLEGGVCLNTSGAGQTSDLIANMGVAAYTLRLIALWGRMVQYMNLGGREKEGVPMWSENSSHAKFLKDVEEFDMNLPERLRYNEENLQAHVAQNLASQFLYMHIAYNQCALFINRYAYPAIAVTKITKDMPNQFLWKGRKLGLRAANAISDIIKEGKNHRLVVAFAGYCTYLSSAVHIHGVFSRDPALEASSKEQLACNIKYLSKLKKYWGMFHFLSESLKDLYRLHADAAAKGTTTPSTMSKSQRAWQYGDWFDQYPHGVSQTDYEVPMDKAKKEVGDDAVLSQKSDLQTVEDFFAANAQSSPGSKAKSHKRVKGGGHRAAPESQAAPPNGPAAQHGVAPPQLNPAFDLEIPHSPFGFPESYDRSQIQPAPARGRGPGASPEANQAQGQAQAQAQAQRQAAAAPPPPPPPPQMAPQLYDPYAFQATQVSALDRHLVHASLNGLDTTAAAAQGMASDWFDAADLGGFGGGGGGYLASERGSAWFMPFNINPSDFQAVDDAANPLAQPMSGWSSPDFWFSSVDQPGPKVDRGGRRDD